MDRLTPRYNLLIQQQIILDMCKRALEAKEAKKVKNYPEFKKNCKELSSYAETLVTLCNVDMQLLVAQAADNFGVGEAHGYEVINVTLETGEFHVAPKLILPPTEEKKNGSARTTAKVPTKSK